MEHAARSGRRSRERRHLISQPACCVHVSLSPSCPAFSFCSLITWQNSLKSARVRQVARRQYGPIAQGMASSSTPISLLPSSSTAAIMSKISSSVGS